MAPPAACGVPSPVSGGGESLKLVADGEGAPGEAASLHVLVDGHDVPTLGVAPTGLGSGDDRVALGGAGALLADDAGEDDGVVAPAVAGVGDEMGLALVSVVSVGT